jgi:hypothetical protein
MLSLSGQTEQDEKNGFCEWKCLHIAYYDMSYNAIITRRKVRVKEKVLVTRDCAAADAFVRWLLRSATTMAVSV